MILVAGDGFTSASYCACPYSWASQDSNFTLKGSTPHPKNLDASFGAILTRVLHQPLRIDAWELNDHSLILSTVENAIAQYNINYLVVTWPSFFRGHIESDTGIKHFTFNNLGHDITDQERASIQSYISNFNLKTIQEAFIQKINALSELLEQKNIHYAFAMSDAKLPKMPNGRWILDPTKETITSWAATKELLNGAAFLNERGQKEFGRLLISYLTEQL